MSAITQAISSSSGGRLSSCARRCRRSQSAPAGTQRSCSASAWAVRHRATRAGLILSTTALCPAGCAEAEAERARAAAGGARETVGEKLHEVSDAAKESYKVGLPRRPFSPAAIVVRPAAWQARRRLPPLAACCFRGMRCGPAGVGIPHRLTLHIDLVAVFIKPAPLSAALKAVLAPRRWHPYCSP